MSESIADQRQALTRSTFVPPRSAQGPRPMHAPDIGDALDVAGVLFPDIPAMDAWRRSGTAIRRYWSNVGHYVYVGNARVAKERSHSAHRKTA